MLPLDRLRGRVEGYVSLLRGTAGLTANLLPEGATRIPRHRDQFATYVE